MGTLQQTKRLKDKWRCMTEEEPVKGIRLEIA